MLFRCGINVAGVVDWATYGAGYTTPRLGTPVENPEIYRVSAPIYHMDKLARPLLVLHGTNDRNVAVPRFAAAVGCSCSSSESTSRWVSIRAKFISSAARTFCATRGGGQKSSSIGI